MSNDYVNLVEDAVMLAYYTLLLELGHHRGKIYLDFYGHPNLGRQTSE